MLKDSDTSGDAKAAAGEVLFRKENWAILVSYCSCFLPLSVSQQVASSKGAATTSAKCYMLFTVISCALTFLESN